MQRFGRKDEDNGESRPLADEQKASIAEARQVHQARVAEREILHQAALRKATSREEIDQLNEALRRDTERLASDRDAKDRPDQGREAASRRVGHHRLRARRRPPGARPADVEAQTE
jgi:predicted phage gp36 major capsid-like protein